MNPWTNLDKDLREAIHYPKSYLKEHEDEVVSLLGMSVEEYLKENKKRLEALNEVRPKSETLLGLLLCLNLIKNKK